ncbi:hypothetical protein CQW23_15707 [Capsicum baccatum]|uniref:A20-type domain-containing protein n=1 Tax=Capsicum baccatum TaxID=33114 RepID=A0A2G2WMZ7_CAPBA|nr:hypothetical protein CQW23_15707 [Capsicum baccatum]
MLNALVRTITPYIVQHAKHSYKKKVDIYWRQPNGHSTIQYSNDYKDDKNEALHTQYIFCTDVPHGGPVFHAAGTESSKEIGCRAPEDPVLCINDCDFFGSAATMNMCSKCQKDKILLKKEHAKLAAASSKVVIRRSSSSDESELALAGAAVASADLASQISQITDKNSGVFPNAKNNGMTNTRCVRKREIKAPSLVARIMGLESMPMGSGSKPQKASVSETWRNMADKLGARPGGSDKEDMDFEMAEINSSEPSFQRDVNTGWLSPSELTHMVDKLGAPPGGSDEEDMDFEMAKIKSSEPKDKVLVESVDSVDDEPLFLEPNRDLSDYETSLSTRRSCRELIHNLSGVLNKINQLKGSKLSCAKQVILNVELIFGTTPQQALPVEDGFSGSHFLLNVNEMFLSFLWMAFGELLGCNDPKKMNQLKGFAFDCLLEYLGSKFYPISDSCFRTYTKLPSSMTKEILIADIIDEVEEWTQFFGLIPDELIEWAMSHSLGKCTGLEIEEYGCGTEVARHILQELEDEVVLDLYSSS